MSNKSSQNNKPVNPCKAITGEDTRLCYPHVWEPYARDGEKQKYSCCAVFPKTDLETVEKVKNATEAAYREGEAKLKGSGKSVPPITAIRVPLRDGDLERPDDPAFAGMWFINAKSDHAPGIVDMNCEPILDRDEVYPGCYCRISLSFYAYNFNGNRGIACGLNNLQKVRDGERLGSHSSAADDFGGLGNGDRRIGADEDFLA